MALAWRMHRRLMSHFANIIRSRQPSISFFRTDSSPQYRLSSFLHGDQFLKRQARTFSETRNPIVKINTIGHQTLSSRSLEISPNGGPLKIKNTEYTVTEKPEMKISPQPDLAMMFTCKVCETLSVIQVCRKSYETSTSLVKCTGCHDYHLIADHLGYFEMIEDVFAANGKKVFKGKSTLELTHHEDLAGMTKS